MATLLSFLFVAYSFDTAAHDKGQHSIHTIQSQLLKFRSCIQRWSAVGFEHSEVFHCVRDEPVFAQLIAYKLQATVIDPSEPEVLRRVFEGATDVIPVL